MQLVPFPLMNPRQPSSCHIFFSAFPTLSLYSSRPALWIWNKILRRSSGETTVRETAPATPPAQNAAVKGCEMICRAWSNRTGGAGGIGGLGPRASVRDYIARASTVSWGAGWREVGKAGSTAFRANLQLTL